MQYGRVMQSRIMLRTTDALACTSPYRRPRHSAYRFVSPPVPEYPTWWEEAKAAAGPSQIGAADHAAHAHGKAVRGLLRIGGISPKAPLMRSSA